MSLSLVRKSRGMCISTAIQLYIYDQILDSALLDMIGWSWTAMLCFLYLLTLTGDIRLVKFKMQFSGMLRLITITAAVILFPKIVSAQASVLATSSDLCVPATSSRIVTKQMKLIQWWLEDNINRYHELKHVVIVGSADYIEREWDTLATLPKVLFRSWRLWWKHHK